MFIILSTIIYISCLFKVKHYANYAWNHLTPIEDQRKLVGSKQTIYLRR